MLCKEKKVSLAELERTVGLSPNSVYRWDKNRPSVDKAKLVSDFFGVTVDELLDDEDLQTG